MTRTHASEVPVYGVPVQTRELFGVLHLKGFVIDDCVIYSGASLNNVYLHKFDKYRFDRYHLLHNRELADSMQHLVQHGLVASRAVHRLTCRTCRPPAACATTSATCAAASSTRPMTPVPAGCSRTHCRSARCSGWARTTR